MASRILLTSLACLALAGCAAQDPMPPQLEKALKSPSKAADCRMVYREASKNNGSSAGAAAGVNSWAGVIAVAVASGVARGIEERRNTEALVACYQRVGAPPEERLPVRGPNGVSEEADMAAIMGTAPSPTGQPVMTGNPNRRSPDGGAGFSTF